MSFHNWKEFSNRIWVLFKFEAYAFTRYQVLQFIGVDNIFYFIVFVFHFFIRFLWPLDVKSHVLVAESTLFPLLCVLLFPFLLFSVWAYDVYVFMWTGTVRFSSSVSLWSRSWWLCLANKKILWDFCANKAFGSKFLYSSV